MTYQTNDTCDKRANNVSNNVVRTDKKNSSPESLLETFGDEEKYKIERVIGKWFAHLVSITGWALFM